MRAGITTLFNQIPLGDLALPPVNKVCAVRGAGSQVYVGDLASRYDDVQKDIAWDRQATLSAWQIQEGHIATLEHICSEFVGGSA